MGDVCVMGESNTVVDSFRLCSVGGKTFFNHLMTKTKTRICIHNNLRNVVLMILSNYFNSIAHCLFLCCIVTIDC